MTKKFFLPVLLVLAMVPLAAAQGASSLLKPPKGAPVAMVVFEDLECPMCAHTAPLLKRAEDTYHIPLVVYDFPLPQHNWSYQAAIFAHYFDSHSKELGHEFRNYIFAHQTEIYPGNLRGFVERFASAHNVDLPFVIDPQGKFAAEINADKALGKQVGIEHTPTVFVVSDRHQSDRVVEVKDPDTQLFQMIDAFKQ